ncbi:MAG: DNA mismatch repair endonuclease MutL [Candidatus Micrarchaeota archaeon]|nr:DNA mismatch repair endonuclease MutL [Candidatus Micrarchaeota archaeon]
MGEIFEMPQRLREKIAAGEVITAPHSVVKELIENSIDAGADEIKVYIEKGGKRLVRVVDNGRGIARDDLEVCGKRFTTSKIRSEEELERISTLGFRGEALASICAVSELSIQSRRKGAAKGYVAEFSDDGSPASIRESPIAKGTIVEVRNLFSRFPVRLKFLKSDDAEAEKIASLVTRYSLVSKSISFALYKDGEEVLNSPKSDNIGKVLYAFGREIAENVIRVEHCTDSARVAGYVSKVGYSRKTRDYQVIFINGRMVKSRAITSAIESAYSDKIFLGRYPVAILNILIDPEMIDVNIHPTKEEVKLRNEHTIAEAVTNAIRKAILENSHSIQASVEGRMSKAAHTYPVEKGRQETLADVTADTAQKHAKAVKDMQAAAGSEFLRMRVLGQLNKTYIIAHDSTGIILIDQHAAQERVFYEKFTAQLRENAVGVNRLLKPFVFQTTRDEEKLIEQNRGVLERYGLFVEMAGRGEYALTSVPALFGKAFDPMVVKDIIDELRDYANSPASITEELDNKIATRACRKAIKGGDELTIPQINELLAALAKCRNPYTCPHGRPTTIRMSWGDIERKFKRSE